MLRLLTLGGLSAQRNGVPISTLASRRRPLLLLAVVAAARDRGVSRERLARLFWPERDEDAARNAVRQALFVLRRDSGRPDLLVGSSHLRLDPAAASSDFVELEEAAERGDHEAVVRLFAGPFLDGVPGEGEELRHWIAETQSRIASRHEAALEALAQAAGGRGDLVEAARLWRQRAAAAPLDARVARSLVSALVSAGDPVGALQHVRSFEAALRRDAGLSLDADLVDVAQRIEGSLRPPSVAPGAAAASPVPGDGAGVQATSLPAGQEPQAPASREPAQARAPADGARARAQLVPGVRRRWTMAFAGALLLAAAAGGLATVSRLGAGPAELPVSAPALRTIVVFDFDYRGDSRHAYLRKGLPDLISGGLDGAPGVRSVDRRSLRSAEAPNETSELDPGRARAIAARVGARGFVLGSVIVTGPRARLIVTPYDALGRVDASVVVRDTLVDAAFALADRAVAELLTQWRPPESRRLASSAAATTSLAGLKAFLAGESLLDSADYLAATEAFQEAVRLDRSFALGYYRLSLAADWSGQAELARAAADTAHQLASRLGPHDAMLVEAQWAWRAGRVLEAEARYDEIVRYHPDDLEAWFQLGEIRFHDAPRHGRSVLAAKDAFEHAARRRSRSSEVLTHLVRLAMKARDRTAADTLLPGLRALGRPDLLAEFAFASGAERERSAKWLGTLTGNAARVSAWRLATYAEDLVTAETLARSLERSATSAELRSLGYAMTAALLMGQGRWTATQHELRNALRDGQPWAAAHEAFYATLPWVSVRDSTLHRLDASLRRWDSLPPGLAHSDATLYAVWDPLLAAYPRGLVAARLGERARALRQAASLEQLSGSVTAGRVGRRLASALRADLALRQGRYDSVLALLDSSSVDAPQGPSLDLLGSHVHERWLRAEALRGLKRDGDALALFESIAHTTYAESPYLVPGYVRVAQLCADRGDLQRSRAAAERARALWRSADPPMMSWMEAELGRTLAAHPVVKRRRVTSPPVEVAFNAISR
jgi:serine/threonine-protein kinase